jgi:hypothetical protein
MTTIIQLYSSTRIFQGFKKIDPLTLICVLCNDCGYLLKDADLSILSFDGHGVGSFTLHADQTFMPVRFLTACEQRQPPGFLLPGPVPQVVCLSHPMCQRSLFSCQLNSAAASEWMMIPSTFNNRCSCRLISRATFKRSD